MISNWNHPPCCYWGNEQDHFLYHLPLLIALAFWGQQSIKWTSNPEIDAGPEPGGGGGVVCSSILPQDPPICHGGTLAGLIYKLRRRSGFYTQGTCTSFHSKTSPVVTWTFWRVIISALPFMTTEMYRTVNQELWTESTKSFVCVFITQQVSFTVSCLIFPASGSCPAWQGEGRPCSTLAHIGEATHV